MRKSKNTMRASVVACLFVQVCIGILYLWSVYRSPVVAHYNWTMDAATMVASYMIFAFVVGNLIGGIAQIRFGSKAVVTTGCLVFCSGLIMTSFLTPETVDYMYLTYSLISGLGCGFAYGNAMFCVIRWMPHRRGLAAGMSAAAFGLSTVIFAPISRWLLGMDTFGDAAVPMTFRILGITFLIISMVACMFIRTPSDDYLKSLNLPAAVASADSLTPWEVMRRPAFWATFISCWLLTGLWLILVPLMVDLGTDKQISAGLALLAVSLSGLANAAGRLILASLSDKIGRTKTAVLLGVLTTACSLGILWLNGPVYIVFVLVAAFTYGGASSIYPALITDLYGPKYASVNYGILLLSLGVSSVTFNTISNRLAAETGGYAASFTFAAAAGVISILLMVFVIREFRWRTEKSPLGQ